MHTYNINGNNNNNNYLALQSFGDQDLSTDR